MTSALESEPRHYRADQYALAAVVALLAAVYLFSPLASYIGALLYLTIFSRLLYPAVRVGAAIVTVLSGASIWASRTFGRSMSDDFEQYYEIYSRISNHEWTTGVIPAYEFGLPAFFKVISMALPSLTPSGLMFVVTVTAGLIMLFYLERFGLEEFPREKKAYCVAMVFLFFSFVMVTQLTRQMLSSVLLVYLFFVVRPLWKWLSLIVASAIHITAVAVHAVVRALQGRYLILLFAVAAILVAQFVDIASVASALIGYDIPRLGYYLVGAESSGNLATLAIVVLVAVAGALSLLALKASNQHITAREKGTLIVLAGVIVIYLLTLNVTLLPFRLFLIIHAVMAGWFFAFFTRRFPSVYLVIGGVALIFWRTRSLYVIDPASAFVPWGVYGAFGALPGYFFLSYIAG